MSRYSTFEPGQHVIVCLDNPDSGETLGYYGTIIRVLSKSKTQFPDQPQLWTYWVSVPYLNREIDVPARMLLSTGIQDSSEFENELKGKIVFDKRPDNDNEEIAGSYRLPSCGTTYFMFRKSDGPVATYKLDMQISANRPESILTYDVPKNATLNSDYILKAIRDLLGIPGISENDESTG